MRNQTDRSARPTRLRFGRFVVLPPRRLLRRKITTGYGAPGGDDDRLSRVQALTSAGEAQPYVSYTYLPLASNVRTRYDLADAELSFISLGAAHGGLSNDPYKIVDRTDLEL